MGECSGQCAHHTMRFRQKKKLTQNVSVMPNEQLTLSMSANRIHSKSWMRVCGGFGTQKTVANLFTLPMHTRHLPAHPRQPRGPRPLTVRDFVPSQSAQL